MMALRPGWQVALVVVVVGAAALAPGLASAEVGETGTLAANETAAEADNETAPPSHRDPENNSERGDTEMYQRWLSGEMSEAIVDCTNESRIRQLGACDLNRSYPNWLDKYVNVTGESAAEGDGEDTDDDGEDDQDDTDDVVDAFSGAKNNTEQFTSSASQFWQIYQEYRQARAANDTERTRRLVRQLRALARQTESNGDQLRSDLRVISNRTAADASENITEAIESIQLISTNITEISRRLQQDALDESILVATNLSVRANRTRISFLRPVGVTGRLRTANGTLLTDRRIQFSLGGRVIETRTDRDGQFEFRYRPVRLPLSVDNLTIQYVPRGESAYQRSSATVSVEVTQVFPSVQVSTDAAVVTFGEQITVNGQIGVANRPVSGVPIRVSLGDAQTAVVRTGPVGRFTTQFNLSADVDAGSRTVEATVTLTERALFNSSDTARVTVIATPTLMTIDGQRRSERTIVVGGVLRTIGERPVPGQPVQITVNGTTVGQPVTNRTGDFSAVVRLPDSVPANATVELAGSFDGTGTNLNGTVATTQLRFGATSADILDFDGGPLFWLFVIVFLAGFGIVGYTVWGEVTSIVRRTPERLGRRINAAVEREESVLRQIVMALESAGSILIPGDTGTSGNGDAGGDRAAMAGDGTVDGDSEADAVASPLQEARRQLTAGDVDAAVETAYAATRDSLDATVGTASAATHWEFYAAARDRLADEQAGAVRRLTEAYEAAAFAPGAVDADAADGALEAARTLRGDGPVGEPRSDGGSDVGE